MVQFLLRTLWRILIFGGGAVVIYFTATQTFKYADMQLNAFVALFIVYCLLAYGVIPLIFRLYHVVFKHDHIPLYVTTSDGWASDPVNLAIVCRDKKDLQRIMQESGWYEAHPLSLKNNIREGYSILFNTPYPEAPVSNLYLFNRSHDIAFQIPTTKTLSARSRHHVRFWRLEEPIPEKPDHNHFLHWSGKLKNWIKQDKEIWIGACTEDARPIGLQWRTFTITHGVSHEADKERDFIIETLAENNFLKNIETTDPGQAMSFRGTQFRTVYVSDGSIKIVTAK